MSNILQILQKTFFNEKIIIPVKSTLNSAGMIYFKTAYKD